MTWQAPCGTWHPHPPHDTSPGARCQGLTQQEADLGRLVSLLTHVCAEHAPPLEMPPGVRLFCHPSVHDLLSREHGRGPPTAPWLRYSAPGFPSRRRRTCLTVSGSSSRMRQYSGAG